METLPNYIIFKEAEAALKDGKQVKIRVIGKSMEPFLIDNTDIVKIIPVASRKLQIGDIVLFNVGGFYCLHRIIQIEEEKIVLCGDGICESKEIISPMDIIGVLHSVIRQSGDIITCNSILWKIKSHIWVTLLPFRKYLLYIYHKLNIINSSLVMCLLFV